MKLHRILLFVILEYVILNLINAQSVCYENSLFWQVTGNGLKQPSYIFGTVHIIEKKDFFMDKIVLDKLKSSQTLVLETDIELSFTQQLDLINRLKLQSDKTIADYMTISDFENLKKYCLDTFKMSQSKFQMLSHFKPFMLTSYLETKKVKKPFSYEKFFLKKSKKFNLNIDKLETIEEQLSFFDYLTIEEQCTILFKPSSNDQNLLYLYYKQQNINKLQEISVDTNYKKFSEILIKNRNQNWIPKIENFIKLQRTFIAVGAGHLGGEFGILNMLKQKGYAVEPIFFNSSKK